VPPRGRQLRWCSVMVGLFLGVTACGPTTMPTSHPLSPVPQDSSATPEVVSTRLTALLIGELVLVDNCLRIKAPYSTTSHLLVWPPDFEFRVRGDIVEVTDKLYGDTKTWHLGDTIEIGGGEILRLDEQLQQRLPVHCRGPYWVFGGWLRPTQTPK
jgi:hypothetical protein